MSESRFSFSPGVFDAFGEQEGDFFAHELADSNCPLFTGHGWLSFFFARKRYA
jgi:hypothetical protein